MKGEKLVIINKDGKLFGKISIIDIAVVLIIIVLAVGICGRFMGGADAIATTGEKISCTFLIQNIREYSVKALEKGGPVYDKVSKEYIGEIVDVRYEGGEYKVNKADGTFVNAVSEDRFNTYVTVEFSGKIGDNGYYTAANKYLAAGTSVVINTKYAQCESTVYSIGAKTE